MIRVRDIDHLVLRVVDAQAMVAFYRDVLGCRVERDRDDLGLIQLRAGRSMIDLVPIHGKLGRGAAADLIPTRAISITSACGSSPSTKRRFDANCRRPASRSARPRSALVPKVKVRRSTSVTPMVIRSSSRGRRRATVYALRNRVSEDL